MSGLFRRLDPIWLRELWNFCDSTISPDTSLSGPFTAQSSRADTARLTQALIAVQEDDQTRIVKYFREFESRHHNSHSLGSFEIAGWIGSNSLVALLAWKSGANEQAESLFQSAMHKAQSMNHLANHLMTSLIYARFCLATGKPDTANDLTKQAAALSAETGFNAIAEAFRSLLSDQDPLAARPLTPRERGVLRLLAIGLSNEQIADDLSIKKSTVAEHLMRIYVKIGASNRADAAVFAVRSGIA